MVSQYCLHVNSAQRQSMTTEQVRATIRCMIYRLELLRPLIGCGRTFLVYDESLEMQSIESSGKNILGSVNSLSTDDRTRWFLATKTFARRSTSDQVAVGMQDLPSRSLTFNGVAPLEFVSTVSAWMSFSGTALFCAERIEVSCPSTGAVVVRNCFDESSLTRDWPEYEPSPKHRLDEYVRCGVRVSAMDLTKEDAQAALLVAKEYEGSRYALVRGKIYRFIATNPGGVRPVFHGFRVESKLVPQPVFAMLEQ